MPSAEAWRGQRPSEFFHPKIRAQPELREYTFATLTQTARKHSQPHPVSTTQQHAHASFITSRPKQSEDITNAQHSPNSECSFASDTGGVRDTFTHIQKALSHDPNEGIPCYGGLVDAMLHAYVAGCKADEYHGVLSTTQCCLDAPGRNQTASFRSPMTRVPGPGPGPVSAMENTAHRWNQLCLEHFYASTWNSITS